MRKFLGNWRVRVIVAATLLVAGSAPPAQAEQIGYCAAMCLSGSLTGCANQTGDWCAAWVAGCMASCTARHGL